MGTTNSTKIQIHPLATLIINVQHMHVTVVHFLRQNQTLKDFPEYLISLRYTPDRHSDFTGHPLGVPKKVGRKPGLFQAKRPYTIHTLLNQ